MEKFRELKDGSNVEHLDKAVTLSVYTKCPQKWKLIDMETGEEYIGRMPTTDNNNSWVKKNA